MDPSIYMRCENEIRTIGKKRKAKKKKKKNSKRETGNGKRETVASMTMTGLYLSLLEYYPA